MLSAGILLSRRQALKASRVARCPVAAFVTPLALELLLGLELLNLWSSYVP